jgi:hypothetical protein
MTAPARRADIGQRLCLRQQLTLALFSDNTSHEEFHPLLAEVETFNTAVARLQRQCEDPGLLLPIPVALIERACALRSHALRLAPGEPTQAPRQPMPEDVADCLQRFNALDFWGPMGEPHRHWLRDALAHLKQGLQYGYPVPEWMVWLGDRLQLAFTGLLFSRHQTSSGLQCLLPFLNGFAGICSCWAQEHAARAEVEPPALELVKQARRVCEAAVAARPPDAVAPTSAPGGPSTEDKPAVISPVDAEARGLALALGQADDRLVLQYRNRLQYQLSQAQCEPNEQQQALLHNANVRLQRGEKNPAQRAPQGAVKGMKRPAQPHPPRK